MLLTPSARTIRRQRRGVEVLELVIVTPIVMLTLLAAVHFSMLTVNQAIITHAAAIGAREAAQDQTLTEVLDAVNNVLEAYNIQISNAANAGTALVIQDGASPATPVKYGDPGLTDSCNPPASPSLQADEVRVTICIEFDATKTTGVPVMAPFSYSGFSFTGRRFEISAMAQKEA